MELIFALAIAGIAVQLVGVWKLARDVADRRHGARLIAIGGIAFMGAMSVLPVLLIGGVIGLVGALPFLLGALVLAYSYVTRLA